MFDGFQAHCASKESDLVGALLQLLVDRQLPWLAAVFALGGCELVLVIIRTGDAAESASLHSAPTSREFRKYRAGA